MSRKRGFALAETQLASFDRSTTARCHVQRPDRYRLLEALPADARRITRGGGVSFVGASFAHDSVVQEMGAFDRLLEFDPEQGRLTVEAGARIGDVTRFALSRGWMLPVVPGHPRASIGGCIAADVHGKNPARDGTFRQHVEGIELFDAQAGWVQLGPNQDADHFAACFAGFGIPGLMVRAQLRLVPAAQAYSLRSIAVANLVEAAEVLRSHANAPLLYGWHDGRAGRFGRGAIRFGLEAKDGTTGKHRTYPDLPETIAPWPITAWNRIGIAAMNRWVRHRQFVAGQVPTAAALFPLNEARRYFAGFGKHGMNEAQWLLPHASYAEFVAALEAEVRRLRPRISLIASKLFEGKPTGFSFDGSGIALAIQMPQPRQREQAAFIESLTELAIIHGGRPNLIKDSSLQAATLPRCFADFDNARNALRRFDPAHAQESAMTRRLGL